MLGLRPRTAEEEVYADMMRSVPEQPRGMDDTMITNDWVAKGMLHPVKNQGNCGSCAAFCVTHVLESMACIQKGGTIAALSVQ